MDPYDRLKEATRWMWALGDYPDVASYLEPQADALAVAANVVAGSEVLDVAAGNGNFAIAAARHGARVTATDLTPKMVELGRSRTSDARLRIEWREAGAEAAVTLRLG
jgi:2-polyprenyl-3-methyl-5-hydroxy-6-metoxy-1,4-benzoquinol methylase